jgi:diacylglycerol kinase (ATP)
MTAKVILNPYSDRWNALARRPEAEAALQKAGIEYDFVQTDHPGHGIELARTAVQDGFSPIIAAGGDGAIGEVVNGLYQAAAGDELAHLGILPMGTANDLANNIGLPIDLTEAAAAIAAGKTQKIDLGKVNEWVFDNNSAIGLEPVVTIYNVEMVRLRGVIRYLVAALRAILQNRVWNMRIKWDDGSYEGPVSLVTVGNCAVTGGLFKMAPAADPTDGKLTFVYGYAPSRLKMLGLLPKAISGAYVNDPVIHQHHTTRLEIEALDSTPLQVDGEIRETAAHHFIYEALPARLNLLAP